MSKHILYVRRSLNPFLLKKTKGGDGHHYRARYVLTRFSRHHRSETAIIYRCVYPSRPSIP